LVVKKWRHSQLYLEKINISTLINKCPGFPGNSWQKELAQKKKGLCGSDPKNTNLQFTPPMATNMEVNLRIVTLVNVEEKNISFFLHYGKRRGSSLFGFLLISEIPSNSLSRCFLD
jgi:hypothetical protein